MAHYSRILLIVVCLVAWTIFKTGLDISTVYSPKSFHNNVQKTTSVENSHTSYNDEEGEREHRRGEQNGAARTQATEHVHSKSNIRRRSAQEMAKITLAKDTRMKQEMTKYISRTEAERQIKELQAELNRLFNRKAQSYDEDKNITLSQMLAHVKQNHQPPTDHDFGFDVTSSDHTPVNRTLPDLRHDKCKQAKFDLTSLPTVTVITPFHNEAVTMLLRHIHALVNNSPPQLLKEIILVDDVSSLENLGEDLETYVRVLDKRIKLIRNKERQGVSRSRMAGADAATSEVLVFLDSHMECTTGWLEPLVARLVSQSNLVVQPLLPNIFTVENSYVEENMRGAFDWDLSYAWSPTPTYIKLPAEAPYPTPALTGCAIAVTKQYFYHLGGFDPAFEIWGGEHFELAFRTWMCGGRLEVVPCSMVGHLYKLLTHDFLGDGKIIRAKNNLRVAEIWMDEYKEFIYASYRSKLKLPTFSEKELKSIEARRELRRKLKCGSFKNYIEMFPELIVPPKDSLYFGAVKNTKTSYCLVVQPNGYVGVGNKECGGWRILPEEQFIIDREGRLMLGELCVGVDGNTTLLRANENNCDNSKWKWTLNSHKRLGTGLLEITGPAGRYCVVHNRGDTQGKGVVKLTSCNTTSTQVWSFAHKFDFGVSR